MGKRFKTVVIVGFIIFAAVLFLLSPFFYVNTDNLQVIGCVDIPREEILARAGIGGTTRLITLRTDEARKKIMENLYIDHVDFEKKLPGTLTVTVRERHLCGYVEYEQGKYLYIDGNGRVLEIKSNFTEKLPVVGGLKFTRVRLGEILEVEDAEAFKIMVAYARLFPKYEMSEIVSRIDLSDSANARIIARNIDFNVGGGGSADEKVRTIKAILGNLASTETLKGFVDLKEIREQYFLRILT